MSSTASKRRKIASSATTAESSGQDGRLPHTATVCLTFSSPRHAKIALNSLEVDPELDATTVHKKLRTSGEHLFVDFSASEVRILRVALSSFFDMSKVVADTLDAFG